jgi:hypothetical protein
LTHLKLTKAEKMILPDLPQIEERGIHLSIVKCRDVCGSGGGIEHSSRERKQMAKTST